MQIEAASDRFSHRTEEYPSIEEATVAFLNRKEETLDLDGVPIDWDA